MFNQSGLNLKRLLPLVKIFPALNNGFMFSRASYCGDMLTCLPRLPLVLSFSRPCHRQHVFPRLPLVTRFPRYPHVLPSSDWFITLYPGQRLATRLSKSKRSTSLSFSKSQLYLTVSVTLTELALYEYNTLSFSTNHDFFHLSFPFLYLK